MHFLMETSQIVEQILVTKQNYPNICATLI